MHSQKSPRGIRRTGRIGYDCRVGMASLTAKRSGSRAHKILFTSGSVFPLCFRLFFRVARFRIRRGREGCFCFRDQVEGVSRFHLLLRV